MDELYALSPLDGRYAKKVEQLRPFLSEFGLFRHRLIVMIEYVKFLAWHAGIPVRAFTDQEILLLDDLKDPSLDDVRLIKQIETKGYDDGSTKYSQTNHDVKACEIYLRIKLSETSLADVIEWLHFSKTSEDVNNIAYALMLEKSMKFVVIPTLHQILDQMEGAARKYAELPMLARTHGQPASPTTLGKEFAIFYHRLLRQVRKLHAYQIMVKLNGATGNYNALHAAYPNIDCVAFTMSFIRQLCLKTGAEFEVNYVTGQIEPHDTYAELFSIIRTINTILIDFCCDIWQYISDEWLVLTPVAGDTGSSTMPHKVNPIDWENSEGNHGVANALLTFFSEKLPRSRLQRDLSDSTVERAFGEAIGHGLVAYQSILTGFGKIHANAEQIEKALQDRYEVVTEAVQTILRSEGYPKAYDTLKDFSRGKKLTAAMLHEFLKTLALPNELHERLIAITPLNYTGIAAKLAVRML